MVFVLFDFFWIFFLFSLFILQSSGAGFTVSVARQETTVSCDQGRSKIIPSVLFKKKSICLALFSAFSDGQVCESRIHLEIKFGEQPFPKQNSISLNVSRSPIGFRLKAIRRSSGQLSVERKRLRLWF